MKKIIFRLALLGALLGTLLATLHGQIGLSAEKPAGSKEPSDNARRPVDDEDLQRWLQNMVAFHRFSDAEVSQATGLTLEEVAAAKKRFGAQLGVRPRTADRRLLVLPYPGGRHPRIGFLDGAVDPQRETKVSVFLPWDPTSYIVLDLPEAIWWKPGPKRELLYLAHTHIDTTWSRQGIDLARLEWKPQADGSWKMERRLPNGVVFGTQVRPTASAVRMRMWLTNGTQRLLTGLTVQNCIMLKGAPRFAEQTSDNKVLSEPYIACRNRDATRWIITAWEPCERVWANPPCPCMHSDPRFPDCKPGETVELHGWLSFYEGKDVHAEIRRIDAMNWSRKD